MTPIGESRPAEPASPLANVRAEYTQESPDGDDEPADATSCDDG